MGQYSVGPTRESSSWQLPCRLRCAYGMLTISLCFQLVNLPPHANPTSPSYKRRSGAVRPHCRRPCKSVLPTFLIGSCRCVHLPVTIPPPCPVRLYQNTFERLARDHAKQLLGMHRMQLTGNCTPSLYCGLFLASAHGARSVGNICFVLNRENCVSLRSF